MNEEKLTINVPYLERKATTFNTVACVVEKVIPVDHYRFRQMRSYPMQDYMEISDNIDCMFKEDGNYHCLLIFDKEKGDGLLVESEGFSYFRYAQYIPQAKLIWEQHKQTHAQEMELCCQPGKAEQNKAVEQLVPDTNEFDEVTEGINMGGI